MRVACRLTYRLPTHPRLWNRLIRSGFIGAPHRQSQAGTFPIGLLNQFFLASASGSTTVTTSA